jgi:hypothetical protein
MASTSFYTLFESASGFALFSVLESEEIGALLDEVDAFSALQFLVVFLIDVFLIMSEGSSGYDRFFKISANCKNDWISPFR